MRGLPVRRIASTALCATLALGIAAPAAMAADGAAARERIAAASDAPVPGVAALLAQAEGLDPLGTVFTPVTDLINTVLELDDGQLTAAQATELADAIKTAVAKLTATTPLTSLTSLPPPALPADPATTLPAAPATTLPAKPVLPAEPALPVLSKIGDVGKVRAAAAADPVADAVAVLQSAVDALLASATSLDVGQTGGAVTGVAVTGVVGGLLDLISATVAGLGLTLPSLPSAPSLLVETSALPVA
ncbi:hypothetical protein [Streptomyces sp. NPDC020951]|uniref:hypothetical protein n=1 Tax=Streptomyces sp. NPDC020951 TaxID=3365104 RepID=UPI003795643E